MSIGNTTQAIDFNRSDLTLILGRNIDLGGEDGGHRNGVGKTTIVNALSYALYGQALTNIKKNNLINKTNEKNMLVTLSFEKSNVEYRIERGRSPNVMKFFINNQEQELVDESQGDSRKTQETLNELLGMSHDMFKNILALSTYSEPFLSMRANDQREIIEQLLGITQLSTKAEKLKELAKINKDAITQEEYRIKSIQDANKKINEQIESLTKRQKLWAAKRDEDVTKLAESLIELENINIDDEIKNHHALVEYHSKVKRRDDAKRWLRSIEDNLKKEEVRQRKLKTEIDALRNHKCYACGSELHDGNQEKILADKELQLKEAVAQTLAAQTQQDEHLAVLEEIGEVGVAPRVIYDTLEQAMDHRSSVERLTNQLEHKLAEVDPYKDQINDMRTTALEEVSWDKLNELTKVKEHQEFLLKLLTNKDSFIRKTIIDQNLTYLNARLQYYLTQIGLPHTVKFLNDLTVQIEELGRELDFYNLSRGEMTRLIVSLSLSFRDVFEGLYQPINLLFIDEMVDNGLDQSGLENTISILKKLTRERNKSVWLISHRDELKSRVNNVMYVVKENGFTTYSTDVEIN